MTTIARRIQQPDFELVESAVVTVATTIEIAGLRCDFPHCFVGVQFFDSADGDTPATPGAGTITVTAETINSEGVFEAVPDNVITAAARHTVTYDANATKVKLVPNGVTTATHYKAVWTGNRG